MLTLLLQGLPPLPGTGGSTIDIASFAINALFALIWTVVAVIAFTFVIFVAMKLYTLLTPGIDEMAELKKGNVAVAIVMFGFILSVTLIVVTILIK